jgi:pimeloyl-ACP methyl ester carboxylesterase
MAEMKTVTANGLEFAYLEAGKGPLVLLLHGFPDTAETFAAVLPELAAAGFHAVAPFQRGYHPSAIPVDGDYSILALGQDALGIMEALGEQSAAIVGHDWGASAAYAAANLAPQRVRKLVTIAIPHPRLLRPSLKLFRRAPHFLLFQLGGFARWYLQRRDFAYVDHLYAYWSPNWQAPKHEIERVKAGLRRPGRVAAALGYYAALFAGTRDPEKQALLRRRTSVPTLAFAGGSDGALDVALYDSMPAAFSGPYQGVVFPDAGHFLHREQPENFRNKLLEFLRLP